MMGAHIDREGRFQSDKYPTCPAGKVPLSTRDRTAQDLLWAYAQRRREVDAEFADDLEAALKADGYKPPTPPTGIWSDAPKAEELSKATGLAIRQALDPRVEAAIDEVRRLRSLVADLTGPYEIARKAFNDDVAIDYDTMTDEEVGRLSKDNNRRYTAYKTAHSHYDDAQEELHEALRAAQKVFFEVYLK